MQAFAEILNYDWQSLEIAFCQEQLSLVRAEITTANQQQEIECTQLARIGRLQFVNLQPAQLYQVKIYLSEQEIEFSFTTLPSPQGKCLCRYAAIADPHLSLAYENRKGRLFRESRLILADVVAQANAAEVDFALLAGDLTNAGLEEEFRCVKGILAQLQAPVICAPGDHDITSALPQLWPEFFPDEHFKYCEVKGFAVLALDTHTYCLAASERAWLSRLARSECRKLLVSHVHLLPQPYLRFGAKTSSVANFADYAKDFSILGDCLLYAGHQNVPCQVQVNNLRQIHLPQTSQYLCSWYLVEVYQNGLYHKNIPISSEILRQQSRLDAEAASALYQEQQWSTSYRQGESAGESNFIIPT